MSSEQDDLDTIGKVLFGYATREVQKILPSDRFAHYTSRGAIEKIIGGSADGKRYLWLRNSRFMNDYTEVEWGRLCLHKTLQNWRLRARFKRALNEINPEFYDKIAGIISDAHQKFGDKAFLMSLALHGEKECDTGKLSMWRAYGANDNACLILNTAPFLNSQQAYETVLSPVLYGGPPEFAHEFNELVYRLERHVHLLKNIEPAIFFENLKRALTFSVLSTKHAGFHEETEWRIIHQHSDFRPDPPHIPDPNHTDELIYQIPIENRPDLGIWGADLDEILDSIVIGPVECVKESMAFYVDLLRAAKVSYPKDRVKFCGIPFRR